jgi:hypothetical protein
MIELWAVIGLTTIDEVFYEKLIAEIDAVISESHNFDGVVRLLQEYNFRLGRYEAGEVVRLFHNPETRQYIEKLQLLFWYHPGPRNPACLTGSSISGLDEDGVTYKHVSIVGVEGVETVRYAPLP